MRPGLANVVQSFVISLALLALGASSEAAESPRLVGHVNDYANILSVHAESSFESVLSEYEDNTTHQIAVLTMESLGGESIEEFSLRIANEWRLGREGLDNGVLMALSLHDRAVRIELGTGMSRHVSDEQAQGIVDEMIPFFGSARFDDGVRIGLEKLMEACRSYKVEVR